MAKKHGVRFSKDIKLPSREEMYRNMENRIKAEEKGERKQKRDSHRAFIQGGVKAGFTVKQVLWVIKHFASANYERWDERIE